MLDAVFNVEWWDKDESPWVDCGDTLTAELTAADMYDGPSRSFRKEYRIGLFNRDGELVGYVPERLQTEVEASLNAGIQAEVTAEYDGDLLLSPEVHVTDSDGRRKTEEAEKALARRTKAHVAVGVLVVCIVLGVLLGLLL